MTPDVQKASRDEAPQGPLKWHALPASAQAEAVAHQAVTELLMPRPAEAVLTATAVGLMLVAMATIVVAGTSVVGVAFVVNAAAVVRLIYQAKADRRSLSANAKQALQTYRARRGEASTSTSEPARDLLAAIPRLRMERAMELFGPLLAVYPLLPLHGPWPVVSTDILSAEAAVYSFAAVTAVYPALYTGTFLVVILWGRRLELMPVFATSLRWALPAGQLAMSVLCFVSVSALPVHDYPLEALHLGAAWFRGIAAICVVPALTRTVKDIRQLMNAAHRTNLLCVEGAAATALQLLEYQLLLQDGAVLARMRMSRLPGRSTSSRPPLAPIVEERLTPSNEQRNAECNEQRSESEHAAGGSVEPHAAEGGRGGHGLPPKIEDPREDPSTDTAAQAEQCVANALSAPLPGAVNATGRLSSSAGIAAPGSEEPPAQHRRRKAMLRARILTSTYRSLCVLSLATLPAHVLHAVVLVRQELIAKALLVCVACMLAQIAMPLSALEVRLHVGFSVRLSIPGLLRTWRAQATTLGNPLSVSAACISRSRGLLVEHPTALPVSAFLWLFSAAIELAAVIPWEHRAEETTSSIELVSKYTWAAAAAIIPKCSVVFVALTSDLRLSRVAPYLGTAAVLFTLANCLLSLFVYSDHDFVTRVPVRFVIFDLYVFAVGLPAGDAFRKALDDLTAAESRATFLAQDLEARVTHVDTLREEAVNLGLAAADGTPSDLRQPSSAHRL